MQVRNLKAFKKSIAFEALLSSISAFFIYYEGHSGFTVALALHIPSSIVGALFLETIDSFYFSFLLCVAISAIGQVYIFTKLFELYEKIKGKAKKLKNTT